MRKTILLILSFTWPAIAGTIPVLGQTNGCGIRTLAADSPEELLQGRISGVQVTASDRNPAAAFNVTIRGVNALHGNSEPLWIVDGTILNPSTTDVDKTLWNDPTDYQPLQNALQAINPMDIERIEVLKDISATALYGAMGANGVILITTKHGTADRFRIDWHSDISISFATRKPAMLDAQTYREFQQRLTGETPSYADPVDWQKEALRTAISQHHYMAVSGRQDKAEYYIAGMYRRTEGLLPGDAGQSGNFKINYERRMSRMLVIGSNILAYYGRNTMSQTTALAGFDSATTLLSTAIPFRDCETGNFDLRNSNYEDNSYEYRLIPSLFFTVNILPGFKLHTVAGVDYRDKVRTRWFGKGTPRGDENNGVAARSSLAFMHYNLKNLLSYERHFGRHFVKAAAGVELNGHRRATEAVIGYDYFNHSLKADGIGMATRFADPHKFKTREWMKAAIATVDYTFADKIVVQGIFRADHTADFDPDGPVYYPAGSIAYHMEKEPFLQNSRILSKLTLRGGWGKAGMQQTAPYDWLAYYNPNPDAPSVELKDRPAYSMLWRTASREYNIGMDLGFLKNRITASVAFYDKQTDDRLRVWKEQEGYVHTSSGTLRNRGIETEIHVIALSDRTTRWEIGANIAFNRNEVLSTDYEYGQAIGMIDGEWVSATVNRVGNPVSSFYGLKAQGIVKEHNMLATPPYKGQRLQPGDVKFIDIDGNYTVDNNDRTIIGDPHPLFTAGLYSSFSYKNLHVDVTFRGVYGNDILNLNLLSEENAAGNNNIRQSAYRGAYSPENTRTDTPRIGALGLNEISSRQVEDGSFLKLSDLTIAYDFPIQGSKWIESIRVNFCARNLFVLTKYKGWDPEVNSFADDVSRYGIDSGSYPGCRTFTFGISASF